MISSFSVRVPPSTTVEGLLKALRESPENKDPGNMDANNLTPFNPASIGFGYDRANDSAIRTDNPDAKPNCTWNPEPNKTIQELGYATVQSCALVPEECLIKIYFLKKLSLHNLVSAPQLLHG